MKFFNSRIVTSEISLEDAVKKAKNAKVQEAKSLDELLEGIENAASEKTAESAEEKEIKTAATEENGEGVQVEVSDDLKKQASETKSDPSESQAQTKEAKCDDDEDEDEDKDDEEKESEEACEAKSGKTLKVAKKIDFRNWEAEDVVKAWNQHGSIEACIKNVGDSASDAKTYCGLLQVASNMASEKLQKQAKKSEKKASTKKDQGKKGTWKVLAKLTDKERGWLESYWRKIYGDYYVDAMLEDY